MDGEIRSSGKDAVDAESVTVEDEMRSIEMTRDELVTSEVCM